MTCRFPAWMVLLEPWLVVFRLNLASGSFPYSQQRPPFPFSPFPEYSSSCFFRAPCAVGLQKISNTLNLYRKSCRFCVISHNILCKKTQNCPPQRIIPARSDINLCNYTYLEIYPVWHDACNSGIGPLRPYSPIRIKNEFFQWIKKIKNTAGRRWWAHPRLAQNCV